MSVLKLAFFNIKKHKSKSITLFILIFLCTMLLNIGLTVIIKLDSLFDEKNRELTGAHFATYIPDSEFEDKYESFLEDYQYIKEVERESVLFLQHSLVGNSINERKENLLIFNNDKIRSISQMKTVDTLEKLSEDMIFLPYKYKVGGEYKLGDSFRFTYKDKKYAYTIGGFFEDPLYGSQNGEQIKVFLQGKAYNKLEDELNPEIQFTNLAAIFTDSQKGDEISLDFMEMLLQSKDTINVGITSFESTKEGDTIFITIIAMILIGFSIMMVLVTMLVIRFQISNSIEEDIKNIGILKAIGYTRGRINKSILIQFLLVTVLSVITGIITAYVLMPYIGNVISSSVGLMWPQTFEPEINLLCLLFIVSMVMLVTFLTSRKIKIITPVSALRNGLRTHNFKRNYFPMHKSFLHVQWILSMKSLLTNFKQKIMIIIIITALTFACLFSSVMYYNIKVEQEAVLDIIGVEQSNVKVIPKENIDKEALFQSITKMNHVKKTNTLDTKSAKIDQVSIVLQVSKDFSKLETQTVFSGRQPLYDNEIAISNVVSKMTDKGIGDEIVIEINSRSETYLITGISQQITQLGKVATITDLGIQRIIPDYTRSSLEVYLDNGKTETFIQEVERGYDKELSMVYNMDDEIQSFLNSFESALFLMMLLITVATIIVVSLILYLIIKSMILARSKEYGILKSIGYTTLNLMTQISLSFMPVVIIGVSLGGIIGYYFTNTVIILLLSQMGIYNANFVVSVPIVLMIGTGIAIMALLVSMFISYRIKKISVYHLISE